MRFLWAGGGLVTSTFAGIMTTPGHRGIPAGITAGMSWAADNQAFTKGFHPERFIPWLESMRPYRPACLFVTCPDHVGSAAKTIELFYRWQEHFPGWPLAFVAQDGQEQIDLPDPDTWAALFVGGSTKWKESTAAIEVIKRAQALGKHIHIGRVNYRRRYNLFIQIKGSEEFTCDGTRQRFDGREKTIKAWNDYQKAQSFKLW